MVIGLTSGCFDLIHFGHVHYLQRCRKLCERLIVAIDSDEMIRTAKGHDRPVIPEGERLDLVNSLECVGAAFIMRNLVDLTRAARDFKVTKLFKHQGYRLVGNADRIFGLESGAKLVIVPDVEGLTSTTAIIRKVRETKS